MSETRFAKDQLKAFVERIERLETEKAEIASDIRDVYAEAKGNGYDVRALREIVKLRKQDKDERVEHEIIVDTYKLALGMIADLPLGQAAIARAVKKPRAAAVRARPEDRVIAPPLPREGAVLNPTPIPVHQPVAQVGTQAGIRSALPDNPHPDGAERPPIRNQDSMPFAPASDASAPPCQPPDLGGADDLLGVPAFLRRTADNGVPA